MLPTLNLITIKQKLQEQRANLLVYMKKKQNSMNVKDLSNPDNSDRAMTFQINDRETLLLEHIEGQLDEIDQALKRIEAGTYGICTNCGENIRPARLEIMPVADLCVECQRKRDNS